MLSDIPVKEIFKTYYESTSEVLKETMELGMKVLDMKGEIPEPIYGSLLEIIGEESSISVGFLSTSEGCQEFSDMMYSDDDDDDSFLPDEDVADVMGELINMVGGEIISKIQEFEPGLRISIPIFVEGLIKLTKTQRAATAEIELSNSHPLYLVIIVDKEKRGHEE